MLLVHLVINNIVTEPWSVKIISSRAHKSYNSISFCSYVKLSNCLCSKTLFFNGSSIINYICVKVFSFFLLLLFFWCVFMVFLVCEVCMSLLRPLLHIPYHLLRPPQVKPRKSWYFVELWTLVNATDWFATEALRVFMQEAKGMIYNSRTPSSKVIVPKPWRVFSVFFFPNCAPVINHKNWLIMSCYHWTVKIMCHSTVKVVGFKQTVVAIALKITKHTSGSRVPLTTWLTDWNWWFMQWGLSILQRNIQFRSWLKSSTIDIHSEFWFKKCRIFQSHVLSIWSTYYSIAN